MGSHGNDIFTAPVFRSKPEIDLGFLRGCYWKYSAKPSNIVPFREEILDEETEDKETIQKDVFVAGQDVAAGLVRMDILPRIYHLLEVGHYLFVTQQGKSFSLCCLTCGLGLWCTFFCDHDFRQNQQQRSRTA